ncbi:MAG: hypothetical protein A2V98_26195 [Planctomycetes bacterium RBG_16_64_12]|nr:MAG: hypothetical protein A2V98_26195 [Planctomycetes bacterium RBG_16_64_12]
MQAESEEGRRGVCSSFILHPSSFIVHRSSFILHLNSLLLALTSTAVIPALAADWPTYRGDSRRSGSTAETLPAKLSPQWVYRPRHVPQPAWSGRDTRMPFDRAYHAVIAGEFLFFMRTCCWERRCDRFVAATEPLPRQPAF